MQPPDTPTAFLFKLWPWIEANRIRLIVGTGIVLVAIFLFSFFSWQREQKEIEAGKTLTKFVVSIAPNANASLVADSYLKIANEYPATLAGRRAWLQGAAALFAAGRFADAQAQFQKFLEARPNDTFSPLAALGAAASLEAQGKFDLAVGAYQQVVRGFSDVTAANAAKFALGRINEQQGKFADALNYYEAVTRFSPSGSLASEAGLRTVEIKAKLASTKPAANKP